MGCQAKWKPRELSVGGSTGIVAENAVGQVIVVGIGVRVVVHVIGGVQLSRHQQELAARAHPGQASGCSGADPAPGRNWWDSGGSLAWSGGPHSLIEMKTVAEVELGSQVHAAARGIVAEQGDVGQQGTVVGGEILSAVQAAARQTRVIETVLGRNMMPYRTGPL